MDNQTLSRARAFSIARNMLHIRNIGVGVNATLDVDPTFANSSILSSAFLALQRSPLFSRFTTNVRSVDTGVNGSQTLKVTISEKV